ncbi:MAG: helicase, partial [Lentisphaerae bacterium]|nr:helicase [Lentisphaerota bacterium]
IYGLLHSFEYRRRFAPDLTKMLPRIPLIENTKQFRNICVIGRQLAELHINYEKTPMWEGTIVSNFDDVIVEKMRFDKRNKADDKSCIIFNSKIKVENIPLQAYDYVINGKSAIEWLMERYQYVVNPESELVNDPNTWGKEQGNPKYILELLLRIITVSMKTQQLVSELPKLDFSLI